MVCRDVSDGQRPEHPLRNQFFHLDWFGSPNGRPPRISQECSQAHSRQGERSSSGQERRFGRRILGGFLVFFLIVVLVIIVIVFLLHELELVVIILVFILVIEQLLARPGSGTK